MINISVEKGSFMKLQCKSKQLGISFLGLVVIASLLAMAGVIAAQVLPTLIEYQAISKAVDQAKRGETVVEVRTIFDKAAAIDDIKSISGKDVVVTKEGDKVVVSFQYQREIHLTGPAYLTLKYAGRSK
jgi:predicted transcriptional regulator